MLTDIAKKPEPTTQHLLRRGRKRKVETNGGEVRTISNDNRLRQPRRKEKTSCDKAGECTKYRARGRQATISLYEVHTSLEQV